VVSLLAISIQNTSLSNHDTSPNCEANQCQIALQNGAPQPIWQNWSFYNKTDGCLTGPGVSLFRSEINRAFPNTDPEAHQCTPTIAGSPRAQMFCTDYSDPENGKGWGVNAKNQKCGLSFWFNCGKHK